MKKWLAGAVLLLAVGFVGAVLVHDAQKRPHCERFRAERFYEIRRGMPQTEVETLLGAPPGDYARNGCMTTASLSIFPGGVRRNEWIHDSGKYEVHYTHDGKVAGGCFTPNGLKPRSDSWLSRFLTVVSRAV